MDFLKQLLGAEPVGAYMFAHHVAEQGITWNVNTAQWAQQLSVGFDSAVAGGL